MRKHSARTSENLWLLINIVVYYRMDYLRIHFQLHPPMHLGPRLVLSGRYKRTWSTSYNPSPLSHSPLKRDIIPRHNVRVITINLYDRFTSYRILRVIYRVRRAFEGDFSTSHDWFFYTNDMYEGIFFFSTRRREDRAIVQATKFGPLAESRTGCRFNTKQRAKQRREVCKYDAWILLRINAIT